MTNVIKSNKEIANRHASDLVHVARKEQGTIDESVLAKKTTVKGNIEAIDSIKRTAKSVYRLAESLKKDSKKISTLGKKFDDLDTEFKYRLNKELSSKVNK
ncbi:type VII secretion effector (TIGR04197 family) [Breznakia blatticola]|uniref:Type VII secretion effector (TIGR04197 family) n=1 Tax=Breznakia blatticola TaxID=1754012 RepID=A0A4R7Z8V6_9FIRM|nr:TIGR04197 family type VII secretion effector [Breznakia blatticola]TDW13122.1 type VII secretion effector (TIGR04197 family) [Breznakia blatticola]